MVSTAYVERDAGSDTWLLDFIAWGGDNFFVQGRHDVIQLDLVYDAVVRYIQQQETISPAMDGRVQAVP